MHRTNVQEIPNRHSLSGCRRRNRATVHWLRLDSVVANGKLKLCDGGMQLLKILLDRVDLALGDNEVSVEPGD